MLGLFTSKNLYDIWASECECLEILDFRADSEVQKTRIPGTNNLNPLAVSSDVFLDNENKLFVLIEAPFDFLREISKNPGIDNVFTLEQGLNSWIMAGYPTAPLIFQAEVKKHG